MSNDEIIRLIRQEFDLRPYGIVKMLDPIQPMYEVTASYGHFGRTGSKTAFTWEQLDKVETLKANARW